MTDERELHQLAAVHYPITFEAATPQENGLLLRGGDGYYLLKRFEGRQPELTVALEAEAYLCRKGFEWVIPGVPLIGGNFSLEDREKIYYLKSWHPKEPEKTYRLQYLLGSESLAKVHLAGEGFHPVMVDGWEWPDWVRLFEMARDVIYEMHTTMVSNKEDGLAKYFERTAKEAIRSIEEAIVHLKSVGYHEQRADGIKKGYINLNRVPSPTPGLQFDLVGKLVPDLPACGLGAFLGQMGEWTKRHVINDVVDLLDTYNKVRKLSSDEMDLIKGFLKFPWQFWWVTEEYFVRQQKEKKRNKVYAKALKDVFGGYSREIRSGLQEM